MHYWVGRLVRLGLLAQTREVPRRGRAVKFYRAVADEFFVPFAATPAETLEALLTQYDAPQQAGLARGLVRAFRESVSDPLAWGVKVRAGAGGALEWGREGSTEACPLLDAVQRAWAPPVFSSWQDLTLTRAEAAELQNELWSLWQRYGKMSAPTDGGSPYVLRLGLAPRRG